MFNVLGDISVLALLVAFVAYFVLGGVWFAAVFSKQYKASLGRAADAPQPSSLLFIVGPALCTAVVVVASSVLIEALDITAVGDAVVFALIVGIGYLVANTVNIAINPNMPRPLYYAAISGGYHVLGILLASVLYVLIG